MSRTVRQRLLRGLGANVFGNSISILIQLVTVPVLLHYWGSYVYGSWLVLVAIPGYLAFTDLGFASVAGNEMTLLIAQNNQSAARATFQSAWVFISLVSASVTAAGCLAIWLLPLAEWFHLQAIRSQDVTAIVILLLVYVSLVLQYGLLTAAFRCTGDYAVGAVYYSVTRLVEACAIIAAAILGGTPLYAAAALLAARIAMILVTARQMLRNRPWLWFGWGDARKATVLRLALPAAGFVALPVATAMSLQGMVLTIGLTLGPVAVVTFSALRTLSRVPLSLMGIVNNAVWPEITTAFGHGNLRLARDLHRIACQTVLWITVPAIVVLGLSGHRLVTLWTHGAIPFDGPVFYALLGVAAVNTFWYTSSVILLGASAHQRMSVVVLTGALTSILLAAALMPRLGLVGAGLALLFIDILITPYVVAKSLRLTCDTLLGFVKALLRPPSIHAFLGSARAREAF